MPAVNGVVPQIAVTAVKGVFAPVPGSPYKAEDFPAGAMIFVEVKGSSSGVGTLFISLKFSFTETAAAIGQTFYTQDNSVITVTKPNHTGTQFEMAQLPTETNDFTTAATTPCTIENGCVYRCAGRPSASAEWSIVGVYTGVNTGSGSEVAKNCISTNGGFTTIIRYTNQIGSNGDVVLTVQLSAAVVAAGGLNGATVFNGLKNEIVSILGGVDATRITIVDISATGLAKFSIAAGTATACKTNTLAEFFQSVVLSETITSSILLGATNVQQYCTATSNISPSGVCPSAVVVPPPVVPIDDIKSTDDFMVPGGVIIIVIFGSIFLVAAIYFLYWYRRKQHRKDEVVPFNDEAAVPDAKLDKKVSSVGATEETPKEFLREENNAASKAIFISPSEATVDPTDEKQTSGSPAAPLRRVAGGDDLDLASQAAALKASEDLNVENERSTEDALFRQRELDAQHALLLVKEEEAIARRLRDEQEHRIRLEEQRNKEMELKSKADAVEREWRMKLDSISSDAEIKRSQLAAAESALAIEHAQHMALKQALIQELESIPESEYILKTQAMYRPLIRQPLQDKYLKRPPFLFIRDLLANIQKKTQLFETLFEEQIWHGDGENLKAVQDRQMFMNKILDFVSNKTGRIKYCNTNKLLAGLQPALTNSLLQDIAALATIKYGEIQQQQEQLNKTAEFASDFSSPTGGLTRVESSVALGSPSSGTSPAWVIRTIDLLQQVIGHRVKEQYMLRPPFNFIRDLIRRLNQKSQMFQGLFLEEDIAHNSVTLPKPADRMIFLNRLIEYIGLINGVRPDVQASKILAGHQAEKTNLLLQQMARICINKNVDVPAIIARLNAGEVAPRTGEQPNDINPANLLTPSKLNINTGNEPVTPSGAPYGSTGTGPLSPFSPVSSYPPDHFIHVSQRLISPIISKKLKEKYLERPPFLFIRDIVTRISEKTGFMSGLFVNEFAATNELTDPTLRIKYLNRIILYTSIAAGSNIECNAFDIVAGKQPEITNLLLQEIARLALSYNKEDSEALLTNFKNQHPNA
jgi:hypothetical protein